MHYTEQGTHTALSDSNRQRVLTHPPLKIAATNAPVIFKGKAPKLNKGDVKVMEEISGDILLGEISRELNSAYHKSLRICLFNHKCKTCPLYDERMENEYGTKCLAFLMSVCSVKLSQIASNLEEKGE